MIGYINIGSFQTFFHSNKNQRIKMKMDKITDKKVSILNKTSKSKRLSILTYLILMKICSFMIIKITIIYNYPSTTILFSQFYLIFSQQQIIKMLVNMDLLLMLSYLPYKEHYSIQNGVWGKSLLYRVIDLQKISLWMKFRKSHNN